MCFTGSLRNILQTIENLSSGSINNSECDDKLNDWVKIIPIQTVIG
jgi:hypothetical protein